MVMTEAAGNLRYSNIGPWGVSEQRALALLARALLPLRLLGQEVVGSLSDTGTEVDWETSLEATLSLTASEDLVDLVQLIQRLELALNCSQRLEPVRRTQWQMQQLGLPSFFYPYCSCAWPFWCSEFCSIDQTITVQRGSVLDVRGPEWFSQSFCSLWISTVLGE